MIRRTLVAPTLLVLALAMAFASTAPRSLWESWAVAFARDMPRRRRPFEHDSKRAT